MKCPNPFAFRPLPVSFWTAIVYLTLLIPLVVIHETVPPAPTDDAVAQQFKAVATGRSSVDLAEAWHDLKILSQSYHPYNSRNNDQVRIWLYDRIREILEGNGVYWSIERMTTPAEKKSDEEVDSQRRSAEKDAVIFDDNLSNITMTATAGTGGTNMENRPPGTGTYFEGTNLYVYIRGKQDADGDWWNRGDVHHVKGGVMVNAHYDSVSTGYGATDDGMGVVTVLQLIKHFTTPGNQPEHGIIALLNNGEEDYLWGARAFSKAPVLSFIHMFLNLEGAGAGGRAMLFRTTDQEVTKAYKGVQHPFGSVLASDGFSMGLIRSQTDYVVLNGIYGQRGLDLAFYRPRARYHTNQDDISHTTRASLWHMLSSSLKTVQSLSNNNGGTFEGPRPDGDRNKVQNGKPSDGVWFDFFGASFAVFGLRTLFAWSLTLLIVSPILLILLTLILIKADKYYFFSSEVKTFDDWDVEPVSIGGWKGLFRFPVAIVIAEALVAGVALLVKKVNPLVVYSSEYTVWAMFISLFIFAYWVLMRIVSFARPTALQRGYILMWLFALSWCILVAVTVFEDRFHIAAGYGFVFFQAATFLALFIALCEQFALPKKQTFAQDTWEDRADGLASPFPAPPSLHRVESSTIPSSPGEVPGSSAGPEDNDEEQPTENTPLVGRTTFASGYRRSVASVLSEPLEQKKPKAYADEQDWSANLPSWTWILQFLILGPFTIILFSELGLLISAATAQTGADGSSLLFPYTAIAGFSLIILLPITPFAHRLSWHIPIFLLVVLVGTGIYNLTAFPFSEQNRYKAYFQQDLDIDTGKTTVKFAGLEDYVRPIIRELPAARGKDVDCGTPSSREGLVICSFDGRDVMPNVAPGTEVEDLIALNITHVEGENKARMEIDAVETKACFVRFERPIHSFEVEGAAAWDSQFGAWPENGLLGLKLWRRGWKGAWKVDIGWKDTGDKGEHGEETNDHLETRTVSGLKGEVVCIWSDANEKGTIPAIDEALQYSPHWAAISKLAEGLVEGRKAFTI